jgi:hypothetical protein
VKAIDRPLNFFGAAIRKKARVEARDLLAPVYGWFTEGFDTLDLSSPNAPSLRPGEHTELPVRDEGSSAEDPRPSAVLLSPRS